MVEPVASLLSSIPDEWRAKFEGSGGGGTRTLTEPNSIKFNAPSHMALVLLTPQPGGEVAPNPGRKTVFSAPAGTVEIVPCNAELFARWKTSKENLALALAPEQLSRLAGLEFDAENLEFRILAAGDVDEKALLLANLIRDEFRAGKPSNYPYLDSLLTVFSTYLLRNYSTVRDRPATRHRGGLTLKAWRDVQDYIRANIGERLSIERLASLAGLSPSHFLRAFKQTVGRSPHQYVLAARLELAEHLVVTTDISLARIASIAGFANHSHLTASMRRHRFTTPTALRRARIAR
ncbi:AraC family transcriptional regulator [Chelativorans sp. AA-79]|uniref:helix-turn-helix domain-containing protein n=1 Tax=Chelativorans sp. AA-79 TaxID=3028735 RepID=UPI0023F6BAA3|nr:AraC family transcriptional regulator [Chelativorans sp. AA-79]WEX11144.1 AraC family transcriptional regulator [Chelativorans sp. AA-79]